MAKIFDVSAYPTIIPAGSDLLIGTDVNDNNRTVTFKVSDIVGGGGAAQDLTSVLSIGNSAANNLTLTGTGILTAVDVFPTVISAGAQGTHGVVGQFLESTGTGIRWATPTGASQTWDDVVGLGNTVSGKNLVLQDGGFSISQPGLTLANFSGDSLTNFNWSGTVNIGNPQDVNIGDFNLVNSSVLKISQTSGISIDDGTTVSPNPPVYGTGLAGQTIVSTGSGGVKWSSGPTITPHTLQSVLTQGNTATDVGVSFTGTSTSSFASGVTFNFSGFVNVDGNGDTGVPANIGILKITNGALDIAGDYSELRLKGAAGTLGQVLLSQGIGATPVWSNAQIAPTLQNVLDNGNTASGANSLISLTGNATSGVSPTEGIIQAQNGAFNLYGDFSELQLKGSAGTTGQVLISQGAGTTPIWGANGSGGGGQVNDVSAVSTPYINLSVDSSIPASPVITGALVSNNLVVGGPVSIVDDSPVVAGTGYVTAGTFDTVAVSPSSGSGLKVNITIDGSGGVDEIISISDPGVGYQVGDTFTITSGNNDAVGSVFAIISGTYYGQTGGFTVPPGNDWDLSFVATGGFATSTTTNAGAGYPSNTSPTAVATTVSPAGGLGATFDLVIDSGGAITSMTLNAAGSGYSVGDVISITGTTPAPTTARTLQITSVNASTVALKNSDSIRNSSVNIDQGSGITLNLDNNNDLTIASSAGGGTVTSIALSSSNSTIGITGSPITSSGTINVDLPAQTAYTAGTYNNSSVTVDDYGIITNISSGTDNPYTLEANAAGATTTVTNPSGGAGYTAPGTVGTTVVTGGGANDLTVTYTNTGGAIDLNGITVVAGGTGYAVGDTFTVNGGTPGSLVTGTVTAITPTEADISLVNAGGVRDTIKIVEGSNISITDSGTDSITIAATAAAGVTSFGLATNPASFAGTVDVTNNTITFVEKVNTIAGAPAANKSYISLDISDPASTFNELTVGLSADTSSLDTTTMLTHYLRADNTWGVPSVAGTVVDSLNALTGALTLVGSGEIDVATPATLPTGGVASVSAIGGTIDPYQTMNNVGYPVAFSTTSSDFGTGCMILATNTGGVLSGFSVYSAGKNYTTGAILTIQEAAGYPSLSNPQTLSVTLTPQGEIQLFSVPGINPDSRALVSQTGAPPTNANPTIDIELETAQKYDVSKITFTGSTDIDVTRVSDTEISFAYSGTTPQTLGAIAPININSSDNIELFYNGSSNLVLSGNNLTSFVNGINNSALGYLQNTDSIIVNDRVKYTVSIVSAGQFPANQQYNDVVTTVLPSGGTGLKVSFLTDINGNIVATNNSFVVVDDGSGYNVNDVLTINAANLTPAGTVDATIQITAIDENQGSYVTVSQLATAVTSTSSFTLNGDTGTATVSDNSILSIQGGSGLDVTVTSGVPNNVSITGNVFTLGDGATVNGVQGFVPGPLIADFGTNKFLKVDATWSTPVTSVNNITDAVTINGTGDISIGDKGAATLSSPSVPGADYVLNRIYRTTGGTGSGCSIKVTGVTGSGVTFVQLYAAGKGYTAGDVLTLVGQGSSGTAQVEILTISSSSTIQVSSSITDLSQLTNSPGYTTNTGTVTGTGTEGILPAWASGGASIQDTVLFYDSANTVFSLNNNNVVHNDYSLTIGSNAGSGKGYVFIENTTNNVRIGKSSTGTLAETGSAVSNTIIGTQAAQSITDGASNTIVGFNALATATVQTGNTIVGVGAMSSGYGGQDVAIGKDALKFGGNTGSTPGTDDATNRVAIGTNALAGETTTYVIGEEIVAIGTSAGQYNSSTAAGGGVFLGSFAGQHTSNNQTKNGINQIAIGRRAMQYFTSSESVAIGAYSMIDNNGATSTLSGTGHIAIGTYALGSTGSAPTVSGSHNIAIGYKSQDAVQDLGGDTIAIGRSTYSKGTDTIAIGRQAQAGTSSNSNSIAIGATATAAGADSIAIGFNTSASGSGSLCIGKNSTAPDDGQLSIGSVTFPLGTIENVTVTANKRWKVRINGGDYYIPIVAVP